MPLQTFSRRAAVRTTATVAAGAALAIGSRRHLSARQADFSGEVNIVSVQETAQAAGTIAAIQAAYPGATVNWRYIPSERFAELFTASEVAGDPIDLLDLNGQDLRRYAVGGRVLDLGGVPFLDRFRDVAKASYTIDGTLWALPRGGIGGFTFFYNAKALARIGVTTPPTTYAELLAMAPYLKAAGIAPFTHSGKNIYLWPIWQFWAHAQTSGNQSVERTVATLSGEAKFTDDDQVQALEMLYRYAQDGMFVENVNSLDADAAWLQFTQGQAAFTYVHSGRIGDYLTGDFPELELGLIPPLIGVDDPAILRQMPGGTGNALCLYTDSGEDRREVVTGIMDAMTSDPVIEALNKENGDPASCNVNVTASDSALATTYVETCAPNQVTYLDWSWPPEITRAFQENQQALVSGDSDPESAADAIQQVLEDLYLDGYEFAT